MITKTISYRTNIQACALKQREINIAQYRRSSKCTHNFQSQNAAPKAINAKTQMNALNSGQKLLQRFFLDTQYRAPRSEQFA